MLRCCTLGAAAGGNRGLLGTIACNGKGRDASSNTGRPLIPVMSFAVMSVPCWAGSLRLPCLVSGRIQRKGPKSCTARFGDLDIKFRSSSACALLRITP